MGHEEELDWVPLSLKLLLVGRIWHERNVQPGYSWFLSCVSIKGILLRLVFRQHLDNKGLRPTPFPTPKILPWILQDFQNTYDSY